jgi:Uma2 family endonuclease
MVEAGLFRDERVEPLQGWLVEISPQGTRHAALNKDRLVKAALYAAAAVQEYWIVDLPAGMIEVHTEPVSGRYTRQTPVRLGGAIRLQAFPDVELQVADILR